MATTIALPDSVRGYIELAAKILIVVQAYLISNAVIEDGIAVPTQLIWILALINAVMIVIKEFMGVRDATTARVSKAVDGELKQFRKIPEQRN